MAISTEIIEKANIFLLSNIRNWRQNLMNLNLVDNALSKLPPTIGSLSSLTQVLLSRPSPHIFAASTHE